MWKSEGVDRRLKTEQYIYIYIYRERERERERERVYAKKWLEHTARSTQKAFSCYDAIFETGPASLQ
jgi:hypothetical protein